MEDGSRAPSFWVRISHESSLPLSEISVEEKLQALEEIWEDLSRNSDLLEIPAWHEEVLIERERQLTAGEASFMDWEQAKAHIRRRVS